MKRKISNGWVWFWLIMFWPVGLYLALVRSNWSKNGKKFLMGFFIFAFIISLTQQILFATIPGYREYSQSQTTTTIETTPIETIVETQLIPTVDEKEKEEKRIEEIKTSISINNFSFYEPNSAGGVEIEIDFKSLLNKEIKYVYFYTYFFNRAEDLLVDEISGNAKFITRCVGPFNKGDKGHGHWGYFYNYEVYYSKLSAVELHFNDGTLFTISGDDIQYIRNWN